MYQEELKHVGHAIPLKDCFLAKLKHTSLMHSCSL